jgi:hypothetical protein
MTEMILPGVYIDVRPEGLIVPGRVSVGNVGIVGTASKGPINEPVTLASYSDARDQFGEYDQWIDGNSNELTLVRALELVFGHGATTVVAVRVSQTTVGKAVAAQAEIPLQSASGDNATLRAKTPGTWGNDLQVNVWDAVGPAFVEDEAHTGAGTITLTSTPILKSARNRIRHRIGATGFTRSLTIIYDDTAAAPAAGQAKIDRASGQVSFGDTPDAADTITASYAVDPSAAVMVRVRQMRGQEVVAQESYTVVSGNDLVTDIMNPLAPSSLVEAEAAANPAEKPGKSAAATAWLPFQGGSNGQAAGSGDYRGGLDALLNEDTHLMVAAGQDAGFGPVLDAHCQTASTDAIKRDRIGVTGSGIGAAGQLPALRAHTLASDRIVFVAPGITVTDVAAPGQPLVTLPGAYAAAAIAGLLAHFPPHVSLTNKTLSVNGLQTAFTAPELTELLQSRVLALEVRQGFRVVRAITTSTNTAWQQITTRRIVDYAKFGVRSAAEPYIGLLNNTRVRAALRATVNAFLAEMVEDEMLVSYELDVTATREDERQGIARVTMVLRPVFSIDFIKVTMFLE